MSQKAPQAAAVLEGTGYSPEDVNDVLGRSSVERGAIRKLIEALDQIGNEAGIARDTIECCDDIEGTAYHLRRAHAHLKFASGVLADLRTARAGKAKLKPE